MIAKDFSYMEELKNFPYRLTIHSLSVHYKVYRFRKTFSFDATRRPSCVMQILMLQSSFSNIRFQYLFELKYNVLVSSKWCILISDQKACVCKTQFCLKRFCEGP